jgi:hypothetical protein
LKYQTKLDAGKTDQEKIDKWRGKLHITSDAEWLNVPSLAQNPDDHDNYKTILDKQAGVLEAW